MWQLCEANPASESSLLFGDVQLKHVHVPPHRSTPSHGIKAETGESPVTFHLQSEELQFTKEFISVKTWRHVGEI